MSSGGRNFPSRGHPFRRPPRSATKPQRPSSLLARKRELKLNGGSPSFIRFPRRIKCSSFDACSSTADGAAGYRRLSSPSGSHSEDIACVVDVDYRSSVSSSSPAAVADCSVAGYRRSSTPSGSEPGDVTSVVDNLDANYRLSSPSSPAAVADSQLKYDVFISFRGKDSRDGFVSHLYDDLCREGTETFIDSEKLYAGEEIKTALTDAIERSSISVVVFTKEYASSKWCLRELAKIMECRRSRGQLVLPVFLGVEPMEVRWQTGCYDVAFARHDKAPEGSPLAEEVKLWRKAMTEAADLSGFDSTAVRPASKLVDKIVARILENLESNCLREEEGLVGAYPQVKEVEELLENGSDEVQTIGIHGLGGSGKTAIAGAVFNRQHQKFDSYCFLANVREESEKHGLLGLRNELLRQILGQTDINIPTPDIGSSNIRNRLRRKRVLVVLDDVSSITQLDFLIKQATYYGPGSRVLITTRDMNVIKNASKVYSVKGLSGSDSLELFSRCAFKQSYPPDEYLQLSMRAAAYAKGLPLALEVLGSFLCKKTVLEWESALRRLESSPEKEISRVLRIGYDGLNDEEKTMFLDIACFFNGEQRSRVTAHWDACGISVDIGIRALLDKCMITLSDDRLHMHELFQEMGREIVRQESPLDPGKRSRLWSSEDGHEVLTENTGTISTEGICLDISEIEEMQIGRHAFAGMPNLRSLKINSHSRFNEENCKIYLPEGLEDFPHKLRLLQWEYYPLENLPSSFKPNHLVELIMPKSKLERLWEGVQHLPCLKVIDVSNSPFLKEFPDVSNAPRLELIVARGCGDLVTIPTPKKKLKSLEHLDLCGCSKITVFPEISWNIKTLSLADTGIEEIPPSIENFHQLVYLDMRGCKMLKNVAQIGHKLEKLEFLDLSGCSSVTSFPDISNNVEVLILNGTAIEEIPSHIKYMRRLELLEIKNCPRLKGLPISIWELPSLVELNISGCPNFTSFTEITEIMASLEYLSLNGTAITELHSSIENLTGLSSLDLENCSNLLSLPDKLSKLKFLKDLNISGCSNLDNLPRSIGNHGSLVNVRARGCKREIANCFGPGLISLKTLDLSDCGITEFPEALTLISTLTELDLSQNCFSAIPPSIKDLQELQSLDLSHCQELQSLSGVPAGLTRLNVLNCRSLEMVVLGNSSELQLYPLSNVETFVFADCPSLSHYAIENIQAFARRRIYVLASHLGVTLNFRGGDLSLNSWMKPQQLRYLLSSLYGYGSLHEALIGLHAAFFSNELISKEHPSRLLSRILHDFHERYRLSIQDMLHFFSLIAHLYLYYQGKPSTNFCFPSADIPEWFCHQRNGSFIAVMVQRPERSDEISTLAGFAISVLVAFDGYNDDKGISIKYECHFYSKSSGTREGEGYLRGWDGKKGTPSAIEGDHLFLGFDSSILFGAANGIEQFVGYSEDLVKATFQCYIVDEDGNTINSCTVKKCAIQPLYTSDMTRSQTKILSRQDITKGLTTRFAGFLDKVLRSLDLYDAVSLGIMNVLGDLNVNVVHQGGYVYITIKCENAGLPIGLQILNVHLGTAPLAVKLVEMAEPSRDPRAFSIEFSDVDGGDFGCRIKVKKCEFRPLQSHVMLIDRSAVT
ncbi:disease resistance-like protein DSC1 [Brassica napus]|uniref:disease resistance-like protein DSC1 n=1 Tax=Brassica napus TaxID=3708 RepID=UPI0004EDCE93|nr:disease resistance-like protein DSC1 [Brassica napus]